MTAFSSLALIALFSAPADGTPTHFVGAPVPAADAVLVQFSSQRCPHCKAMEPIVTRLADQGCPVQIIDVDQQPDVARQFRITGVPTYVALVAGRETGRLVGAASYDRLAALYQATGDRGQGTGDRGQGTGDRGQGTGVRGQGTGIRGQETGVRSQGSGVGSQGLQTTEFRTAEAAAVSSGPRSAEQAAIAATVRLKIEDATGYGCGTGTIIDTHDSEALIVTCGHLFRESKGKGKITADLFAGGAPQSVEGQLITYDLDRDIALVSVRLPIAVRPVQVAPPAFTVRPGDRAFTIGCDKGGDPSPRQSHITAVNKYRGRPNYTAAGQPVDGRSGGGLFSADGLLIGICNAADPADDEGLYAGLNSVHWQLDQIGQSEIYQRAARPAQAAALQGSSVALASAEAPLADRATVPPMPPRMPTSQSPSAADALVVAPQRTSDDAAPVAAGDDSEIVFIVRSKRNPQQRSEVYVVDQAPPDLIARITHAARSSGDQRAALARGNAMATPRPAQPQSPVGSPVVRGQSGEY